MLTYIARRLLYSVPVLFATSFLIFSFVSLAGDPAARVRANPKFSLLSYEHLRTRYHLNDPIPVRYWYWLKDVVTHKLGNSLITQQPIWPDIERVIGHTAQLILTSSMLAILIGVLIGVYSAIRQYSFFDYTATTLSFIGFAMPTFWLGLLLQVLFVNIYLKYHVRIFYTSGLNNPGNGAFSLDRLQHLGLPVAVLAVIDIALYSRFMRASMLASAMPETQSGPTPVTAAAGGGGVLAPPAVEDETYEHGLEIKARSQWAYARKRFLRHRLAVGSLIVVTAIFLCGAFANHIAPHSYDSTDLTSI